MFYYMYLCNYLVYQNSCVDVHYLALYYVSKHILMPTFKPGQEQLQYDGIMNPSMPGSVCCTSSNSSHPTDPRYIVRS